MRAKALVVILLAFFWTDLGRSQPTKARNIADASLRFTAKNGDTCEASVRASTVSAEVRKFDISCNLKVIFSYTTQDHLLDISRDSFDGDRLFTRWEGTTLAHLAIFRLEMNQLASKAVIVFDQSSEIMPDIVSPDTLLFHKDRRFVGSDMLPTKTEVYVWNGKTYELKSSWLWKESMRYEDRFCVVDSKALNCPATSHSLK